MARSRSYDYSQTVIGDCGHICSIWPQIAELGGRNPQVCCEECTRAQYAIPDSERLDVWVYIREKPSTVAPPKKAAKPRVKSVTCSICQKRGHLYTACPLLVGQGTLDG